MNRVGQGCWKIILMGGVDPKYITCIHFDPANLAESWVACAPAPTPMLEESINQTEKTFFLCKA